MASQPVAASAAKDATYCIGVDVGGTFTDVVLSDGTRIWRAKAPSTHGAIGEGVLHGCDLVAAQAGMALDALMPLVDRFGFGTTAVTNVIASRVGLKLGLVTTAGFEDLVPLARVRRVPKDGWLVPPDTLVDRERILGVEERIDRDGKVLAPLDPAQAADAARALVEKGAEAITVSFLWSCANPAHEIAAADAIRAALPGVHVVAGAEMLPVMREYERSTFALLNAYTSRALDGVDWLVDRLSALGLRNPPLLIHSGGGSISVSEGKRVPAMLAESGPAAGVVGALAICKASGVSDAVACDMGGTSFDMSIIRDGEAVRRNRGELMGIWTALPMVDIESVSAGGGSIGWADSMGFLRLGPKSAGAVPGPACYGRGGTEPTVTDALLVLGYLNPARFLGGDMHLDVEAARAACARLGEKIGTDPVRTAWGIREVALNEMVRALRAQFAQKGVDPADFALVSMGGCGGLFNAAIAKELGMRQMLAPQLTSVLSAFGAATADIRRERSRPLNFGLPGDPAALETQAAEARAQVEADLDADGIPPQARSVAFELDLRFARQQWELTMPAARFDTAAQEALIERFKAEYGKRYGAGALVSGAPVEAVSMRAVGTGATVSASLPRIEGGAADAPPVLERRAVQIDDHGTMRAAPVPVYEGDALRPGHRFTGPALVDAPDTTIWLPEGTQARVDDFHTLVIEIAGR